MAQTEANKDLTLRVSSTGAGLQNAEVIHANLPSIRTLKGVVQLHGESSASDSEYQHALEVLKSCYVAIHMLGLRSRSRLFSMTTTPTVAGPPW